MAPRAHCTSDRPDDLIPSAEAAQLLPSRKPGRCVHTSTVVRWVLAGKVRGWWISGGWFVSRAELLGLIELRQPRRNAAAEAGARAAETDRVLREHGVRR
jgi:hypothetical protein